MFTKFDEGTEVTIHSLGPMHMGKTYRGIVWGISVDFGMNPATIYIVEMVDRLNNRPYPYSCVCMPAACLRKGW